MHDNQVIGLSLDAYSGSMQGAPGSRSSSGLSAAHDHHLRMLDMAAYINQGPNADTGLMLDQYGNSFNATAAAALYSPQFAAAAGLINGQRMHMNHDRHPHAGFMNGLIKLETLEGAGTREQSAVTNVTSASGEVSGYSSSAGERETANKGNDDGGPGSQQSGGMTVNGNGLTVKVKAKRKLPGMPDPDAEVVALSPRTLLATNRFICEICNKGFQRDQNLQLHRRGHNLPWKLKQRGNKEVRKKVYVCPEASCVHHDAARALGDLTGIKKHFSRKHGEKKWKCDKCSKRYAVQSDWKAHSKTCGTREYRCDCGTLFSRRDSFTTHRAFCDALAEESALRVQSQLNGEGGHGHLPSAVAAQLLQAGGSGVFSSLLGASPALTSKLGSSGGFLLDHMPPFDHNPNPAAASASSAARAASRLPLWLSAAAAAGDPHNLLSNNIPHPPLSSLQANPPSASLFFSGPPPMPSLLAPAAGSSGMLFGNAVPDSPLLPAAASSYGGLSCLNGLASFSNAVMNNSAALYAAQPHASGGPLSPQISATSLLQKAAQMGSVNASNSLSLFEGSLASSMVPVSSTDAMCWPSPSSMRSSHGIPNVDMNHALSRGQLAPNIGGLHGDKSNLMIDPESRLRSSSFLQSMDNISAVQEMVASFNSGGASVGQIGGPGSAATLFMRSSEYGDNGVAHPKGGSQILGPDLGHPMISTSESCRSMIQPQQNLQQELGMLAPVLNRLSSSKLMKMEDASAAADNFTRDFLGVRGDNVMLESLDKSLSQQRDMAVTYYSNSYNNSKDNLSSEGENMSSQSHPKPCDGLP